MLVFLRMVDDVDHGGDPDAWDPKQRRAFEAWWQARGGRLIEAWADVANDALALDGKPAP